MSSLVLLGEQPSSLELAGLLDRLTLAGGSPLVQLAKDGKRAALLDTGIFAQQATLLAASEEDLSAVLALGFAVLAQLTVASEAAAATAKFAALLTTDPATRAMLKIRTLNNLINVVGGLTTVTQAQRFAVLLQLLEFALAASSTSVSAGALVLQPLATLASMVDFWKLTAEQSLALYAASYKLASVAGVARKSRSADGAAAAAVVYNLGVQPTLQNEYLFALLKAVDAAGAVNPAVIKEKANQDLAVAAVVASVATGLSSTVHIIDPSNVFPLAVVQSLSSSTDAAASAAFQLIRIVVTADLAAFTAFESSQSSFLKSHSAVLDADNLRRKLRTLALCQLAVANQSQATTTAAADNIITYAQIRAALQLKQEEDVEGAVIDAVMAGRLDAKMDQEAETLVVKYATRTRGRRVRVGDVRHRSVLRLTDSALSALLCLLSGASPAVCRSPSTAARTPLPRGPLSARV